MEPVTSLLVIPLNLGFISEIVGKLNGHFKKEGLSVSLESTRGSASALQAVLQGSALIVGAGSIETIRHIATKNAPLVNVGTQTHKSTLGFASAKKDPLIKPTDWRGKKMGVPSEGGTSELTFQLFLATAGVPLNNVQTQVTGFSPATFQLVKEGRIDGYVIGTSVKVIFEQRMPEAVVIDPSKYVAGGFPYITSQRSMQERRDQVRAYMNATRASMEDVLADRKNDYKNILKMVRKRYDFDELKDERLASGILEEETKGWVAAGEENLLRTVPSRWQKAYDQLVQANQAPEGKNPQDWFTNELVGK